MVAPTPVPFFIMVGLYLLSMAAIGIYAAKRTTNLREFFVMNAKAGAILSGLAYFSTQYSMSTFMGVPGTCYKVGYSGLAVSVPGLVFSMIIPALFVGRKLIALGKKHKFLTMADYLGDRYDSQGIRVLLALMMLFFLIPLMGAQTIGAGVIVNVFTGLPYWVGVVAMGVIVIFYCMSGGIRGAILTDAVQGTLMVGTAIVTFILSVAMGADSLPSTRKSHRSARNCLPSPVRATTCPGRIMCPRSCCGASLPLGNRNCSPSSSP